MVFRFLGRMYERIQITRQVRETRRANRRVAVEEEVPAYGVVVLTLGVGAAATYINSRHTVALVDYADDKVDRYNEGNNWEASTTTAPSKRR